MGEPEDNERGEHTAHVERCLAQEALADPTNGKTSKAQSAQGTGFVATIENVEISSSAFKSNPYPFFAKLREAAPVHRIVLGDKRTAWLVTRYDDVVTVLKDDRFAKDKRCCLTPEQMAKEPWIPAFIKPIERNMLDADAPEHTRLRGLVHKAFSPRLVENMRERIQRLTNDLLDAVSVRGRMDLIRDYALPIPTTIISEMLGVPLHDRHKFHKWSNAIVSVVPGKLGNTHGHPGAVPVSSLREKAHRNSAHGSPGRPGERLDRSARSRRSVERGRVGCDGLTALDRRA